MLFGFDRPPRPPRPPRPRLPPTNFASSPVTAVASNDASLAKTANLSLAFVASALALASRASKSLAFIAFAPASTPSDALALAHAAHVLAESSFRSCVFENALAGFVSPHAEHDAGGASEDAALALALARSRSARAASSTHFMHRAGTPLCRRDTIFFENSTAGSRLRPHGPAQSKAPAHCVGSRLARTPRSDIGRG
jgi:hypothetical protein